MSIWVLSDLHLAFSVPEKTMELFGSGWANYGKRIEQNWKELIRPEDLVLIPGDISWAMRLEDALIDLAWIDALPGTKLLLRGNHDYWWNSLSKMNKVKPPSMHFIQNNAFLWNGVAIGGSRLWDTKEYNFSPFTIIKKNPNERISEIDTAAKQEENEKIFLRELERLKISLAQMEKSAKHKIAMVHYPPIGADLAPSRSSRILEEYKIDTCVFGHLHSIQPASLPFGAARGVNYIFASCDYLEFRPKCILEGL